MRAGIIAAALCAAAHGGAAMADTPEGEFSLHALFSAHGVIQRHAPVSVRGTAAPGSRVEVTLGPHQAAARTGEDGRWWAELPAMDPGGPFTLTAETGGHVRTVPDLMIGDVWLCSGQSNMALEMSRALDAPAETGAANDPLIRVMTLPLRTASAPLQDLPAGTGWQPVSPANAAGVSAACYFMARDLRRVHDVPMGLIVSAWGGSSITAWMSEAALAAAGADAEALSVLALYREDAPDAMLRWGRRWEDWWLGETGQTRQEAPWADGLDITHWQAVPAFTYWEEWGDPALAAHDGMVWYRTSFTLSAGQAAQAATLHIGRADEVDQTWLNGVPVGGMADPAALRAYALPPGRLRDGVNTLAINVLDTWRYGGLVGPQDRRAVALADGTSIPLDGAWRYLQVDAGFARPPGAPWSATGGFSQIANAMIAPLDGYALAGVAWYQGESDTHDGQGYARLLAALAADWRKRFGAHLPFLIVQLAGFGAPPAAPAENGWADLRESQRRVALADPHAVIVPAHDVGEIHDIHPPNKQEVGRRLALAARHLVYGEAGIAPSGPAIIAARRERSGLRLHFASIAGTLIPLGSDTVIGFELCGAEGCRYADARVDGPDSLMIAGVSRADSRVRFCWAMHPVCNLVDESGRPPAPFEIAIEH